MGCKIIVGHQESSDGVECAVLFCSTTGVAFGPVMGSEEEAEKFIAWIDGDPRNYAQADLLTKYSEFVQQFVCECGNVREDECEYCDDGVPVVEVKGRRVHQFPRCQHCHETEGDHYYFDSYCDVKRTRQFQAGAEMLSENCNADPAPAQGERFECSWCKQKRERKSL